MLDEEGGGEESGMFRRLRQKSPSRQDLFGSKSFALQSGTIVVLFIKPPHSVCVCVCVSNLEPSSNTHPLSLSLSLTLYPSLKPTHTPSLSNTHAHITKERSNNPVLLDPALSFKSQGITTSRILALRPQTILPSRMTRFQIQVPDWVRFHQVRDRYQTHTIQFLFVSSLVYV